MNLDKILVNEIGQFGRYQLITFIPACLVCLMSSWAQNEYAFTTARIETRCLIEECETAAEPAQFNPAWLSDAVPSAGSSFDNCHRFGNTSSSLNATLATLATCPSDLFDRETLVGCEHYVYESKDTVVYDFNLACQEWRRSLIGSINLLGNFAALSYIGYAADRWGRRAALAGSAVCRALLGLARSFTRTYFGFVFLEFAESALSGGVFPCAYILVLELVGPKHRVKAGAAPHVCSSMGQIVLGLMAWRLPHWRDLTRAVYAPQLLTVSLFWILSESVRWHMSNGRYEKSEAILKKVARINNKQLSEASLIALRKNAEDERLKAASEKSRRAREPWLLTSVFRHKSVLLRCAVAPVWWVTNTLVFYGLSINAVNMSGNKYLNFMAGGVADIPGYLTAMLLLDKIGRKRVIIGGYVTCALCQFAYIFVSKDVYLSLVMYLIGKFSISGVLLSVYMYTGELFPTRHRQALFAFCSMVGRLGSVLAPLTPALSVTVWEPLPYVLFGGMATLSAALALLPPETRGAPLPDTMRQADCLGDDQAPQADQRHN